MTKSKIAVLGSMACLAALVVSNRWLVLGEQANSFYRIWQYFISYADYGVLRRELLGSFLTVTGLNGLFDNAYSTAFSVYSIEIVVFAGLIVGYCVRHQPFEDRLAYAAVFFSPALILQAGYIGGTQDVPILIIAFVAALFIKPTWGFTLACAVGVLTHELFVFLMPALFVLRFGCDLKRYVVPAIPALMVLVYCVTAGTLDVPKAQYEHLMAQRITQKSGDHGWGGYFELSSSLGDNADVGDQAMQRTPDRVDYIAVPLFYALLVAGIVVSAARQSMRYKALLALAVLAPFAALLFGSDIYRWIGLSADMSLLSMLVLSRRQQAAIPRPALAACLCFVLVAPFGSNGWDHPFPVQQTVLHKIALYNSKAQFVCTIFTPKLIMDSYIYDYKWLIK